jgi:hypothetical protein
MKTKDFDTRTMTRATQADINRIWFQLWGNATVLYLMGQFEMVSGEYLDLTQLTNAALEAVPQAGVAK